MFADDYQNNCLLTWNTDQGLTEQRLNAALGVGGESGEFQELMKKHFFHGHSIDMDKVAKELGDIQYYVAVNAWVWGLNLSDIMRLNNEKLAARYKNGFTKEESINRKE